MLGGAAAAAAAEQAFCRTECGYAGVLDVENLTLDDQMPSFFLSETLKYLYLLFDEVNGAFLWLRGGSVCTAPCDIAATTATLLSLVRKELWLREQHVDDALGGKPKAS